MYLWPQRGLSWHFLENMQGMKRSLFKFKMKIVFLRMDNWLKKKKKRKTSSVCQTDSRVHTKNCFLNGISQMVHINTFLAQAFLSYDLHSLLDSNKA